MNLNLLVTLEVFSIIMLIVITWRQDCSELFRCSRDRSKIVRDVIYKKFVPIFVRHQTPISYECPFHPDREILWWPPHQSQQKQSETTDSSDPSSWTCPFCGIDFHCHQRLIFHWDQEHRYSQQYKEDLVCLADYCGIFRCDIIMKRMLQRNKRFFNYLPFGGGKLSSSTTAASSADNHHPITCDNGQMLVLQEMCNNVIQQCTIGAEPINGSSSQTIWTLRKELSDSLCSFLTCEHYNDDLFAEDSTSPKVPIILFTIVGLTMLCGFFLIYYLLWNAFKRRLINDQLENGDQKAEDKTASSGPVERPARKATKKGPSSQWNDSNHHHQSQSQQPSTTSNRFFENIFEFNSEKYDDTFDYQSVSNFKSKLHPINSIIEEEEEESDIMDINVNSYPNIGRKNFKRNKTPTTKITTIAAAAVPSAETTVDSETDKEKLKKSQEICLQDLPMRFHSKYVQPIKHSYSDQYPCYSGPMSESFATLSNKSRSFSHSQLKSIHQTQNPKMFSTNPRRQLSMEEWTLNPTPRYRNPPEVHPIRIPNPNPNQHHHQQQHYAHPHSKSIDWNCGVGGGGAGGGIIGGTSSTGGRPRISKSAMSYHMMHPKKRRELYACSKTNSDASIASGSSR